MADIFFGKFSELISSDKTIEKEKVKLEKEIKIEKSIKSSNNLNKLNKKALIYIIGAILLAIVIFFSF